MQVAAVQVIFMTDDRAVLGYFLHVAAPLVVVAAFHHRATVPPGETHRTVGCIVHDRPDTLDVLMRVWLPEASYYRTKGFFPLSSMWVYWLISY